MAGARPSSFKKAGGFLNGVDGSIVDYQFTTEAPWAENAKPQKKGDDAFNSLFSVVSVRLDGAEEDIQTTLWVGNADNFEISDDGHTLTPADDSYALGASAPWSKFINSLCENGFPESNLPEDEINFEAIIGTRVRFVQVAEIDRTTGKPRKRVAKKGKFKGKEFDQTNTEVSAVIALPGTSSGKSKTPPKGEAKPLGTKATKAAGGKANGKAVEVDLTEEADQVLLGMLEKAGGELAKRQLPVKLGLALSTKNPNREELRRLIYTDEYLLDAVERGVIEFDQSSKAQTISAA